jgi:hypothetical protein
MDSQGKKVLDREEGPGRQRESEQADVAYEEVISPAGAAPHLPVEIKNLPPIPELSPTADHLKN